MTLLDLCNSRSFLKDEGKIIVVGLFFLFQLIRHCCLFTWLVRIEGYKMISTRNLISCCVYKGRPSKETKNCTIPNSAPCQAILGRYTAS